MSHNDNQCFVEVAGKEGVETTIPYHVCIYLNWKSKTEMHYKVLPMFLENKKTLYM